MGRGRGRDARSPANVVPFFLSLGTSPQTFPTKAGSEKQEMATLNTAFNNQRLVGPKTCKGERLTN